MHTISYVKPVGAAHQNSAYQCSAYKSSAYQKGVALITVMVMFAIFAGLAAYLADSQQRAFLRTARLVESSQAGWVAVSAEALAVRGLALDRTRDGDNKSSLDHPQEEWHRVLESVPVGQARVSAQLGDLSGRFNINSLVGVKSKAQQKRFIRLLNALGIPGEVGTPSAEMLTARIVDWIDDDEEPKSGGAESSVYSLKDPPYLPANQPMIHLSELRLIDGFRPEWFLVLEPHVAALPDVNSRENINFSTPEVLNTVEGIDGAVIVKERPKKGYESVQDAFQKGALQIGDGTRNPVDDEEAEDEEPTDETPSQTPPGAKGPDRSQFDVKSQFFLMRAKIEQGGRSDHVEMMLYRPLDEKQPVQVVYRMRVRPFVLTATPSSESDDV